MSNKFDKVFLVGDEEETWDAPVVVEVFADVKQDVYKIKNGLGRRISIGDLDRDKHMSDFAKIQYAFAIGRLRQSGAYGGATSLDEIYTFRYENEDGTAERGLAVVSEGLVRAYYITGVEKA